MSDTKRVIITAAREVLEQSSTAAYRDLIGQLYSAIDRGIHAAVARFDELTASILHDQYFDDFLAHKLRERNFLNALIAADNPVSLTATVASNHARDLIRKSPPARLVYQRRPAGEEDDPESDIWDEAQASTFVDAWVEREKEIEQQDRRQEQFSTLPKDDQLLLGIYFVETSELPLAWVELIAQRRGVPLADVEAELAARASDQGDARRRLTHEYDERVERIERLQHRILQVRAVAMERGDAKEVRAIVLSQEARNRLRASQEELKAATTGERAAYLQYLEEKRTRLCELQLEIQEKLNDGLPGGEKHEDVLRILGRLPAQPKARATAVNSVTQKFRRLRKKLRSQLTMKVSE
jgi:hypothetical protein